MDIGTNQVVDSPRSARRGVEGKRRWRLGRLVGGLLALVVVLVGAGLFLIDEPLRRHLEGALNAELTGYTVHLAGANFHVIGLSLTLHDLVVTQNAHPDPPVAHLPHLHASVHWNALLRGRLLADFVLERTQVRIDRTQLQHEVSDSVALKDEGWQQALEAIYPLKINHFTIRDGELTYIDDDPLRPLHITRVNLTAGNIRNVRSAANVYPSDVQMDGVIFDSGTLRIDGHANFLAEPFPAVDADVELNQVQLDYFKPMLARINLWITEGTLSAAGHAEYGPRVENFNLKSLLLDGVQLDYVHSAPTASAEKERAIQVGRAAEQLRTAPRAVIQIDEVHIARSTLGYVDESGQPGYRLFVENGDLKIRNVSNQAEAGPASAALTGQFMGSGQSSVYAFVESAAASPDLDLWVTIEGTQLRSLNNLLRSYGRFDVVAGTFTFYSQISIKKGDISGYVKPIFSDAQVYSDEQDGEKGWLDRMYERLVGGTQTVLQNRRGEVATTVLVYGRASDPEASTWALAIGLIKNAFIEAIAPGLEPGSRGPRK